MTISKTVAWMFTGGGMLLALAICEPIVVRAQDSSAAKIANTAPPDFSGVYYAVNPNRGAGAARPAGQPGPPPRGVVADGAQGRTATAPLLKPEYMAKWELIRKSRMSGSYEYDNNAKCLPPGMPAMMSMAYGMEVLQGKDRITFFSELNDAMRRVYLDGRKPTQKILDDPTYAGYSTGYWEGDTLVVDTVSLRSNSFIDGQFSPHSDAMTVKERIRFTAPGLLEDRVTVTDPKALTQPWETLHTYRKAEPGSGRDELREFACPEGLALAK